MVRAALLWNDTRSAQAADGADRRARRARGVGRRGRLGARRVVHGHQAAVARATTSQTAARRTARRLPAPRLADLAAARHGRPRRPGAPTGATRAARATGPRRRATTAATCSSSPSATTPCCRGSSGRARRAGHAAGGQVLGPGTGDNAAAALGLGAGPATSSSRSAPPASRAPSPTSRRPTRPASSPASPTPPAASCRWSARSTPRGCSTPPRRLLGVDHAGSPTSPSRLLPGAGGPVLVPVPRGRAHARPPARHRSLHGLTLDTWTPATSPARPSRACSAGSPTPSTPWRHQGAVATRVLLVGGGGRVPSGPRDRARRARPAGRTSAAGRVRRARAPPGRPPGSWPVRPSRRCGKLPPRRCTRPSRHPRCASATPRHAIGSWTARQ